MYRSMLVQRHRAEASTAGIALASNDAARALPSDLRAPLEQSAPRLAALPLVISSTATKAAAAPPSALPLDADHLAPPRDVSDGSSSDASAEDSGGWDGEDEDEDESDEEEEEEKRSNDGDGDVHLFFARLIQQDFDRGGDGGIEAALQPRRSGPQPPPLPVRAAGEKAVAGCSKGCLGCPSCAWMENTAPGGIAKGGEGGGNDSEGYISADGLSSDESAAGDEGDEAKRRRALIDYTTEKTVPVLCGVLLEAFKTDVASVSPENAAHLKDLLALCTAAIDAGVSTHPTLPPALALATVKEVIRRIITGVESKCAITRTIVRLRRV